ncbi:MAG: sigma-70 family RNA polymerase sigma factor [Planctomycetia bacterium]|nr:sigma-70 family RNA polymerase sigma factor [Planctomycetia bacterium]
MKWDEITPLVIRAQSEDRNAFGELVARCQPTIYAQALARLRNATDAQELTQDVFIHVHRKLPQLRDPQCFMGWLRQITARMAINHATRRRSMLPMEGEFLDTAEATGPNPLESLVQSERAVELHAALEQLKPVDRATLIAFYLRSRTLKQMAREFEVPVGTIKRRLFTARNRLKEVLEGVTVGA